jgi:hypothetical protein
LIVEASYSLLRLGAFSVFDECEAPRLAGFSIGRKIYVGQRTDCGEVLYQVRLRGIIGKIPNKKAYGHT